MTIDEMIEVLQAYKNGDELQINTKEGWNSIAAPPAWNFAKNKYRVKPKPMEIYGIVCDGEVENIYASKKIAYESLGFMLKTGKVFKFIQED